MVGAYSLLSARPVVDNESAKRWVSSELKCSIDYTVSLRGLIARFFSIRQLVGGAVAAKYHAMSGLSSPSPLARVNNETSTEQEVLPTTADPLYWYTLNGDFSDYGTGYSEVSFCPLRSNSI